MLSSHAVLVILMVESEVNCLFYLFVHHPEGIKGAAPELSPRPQRGLHKQALHGQTENHGGGEGASSRGLPSPQETETAAARGQDCQSGKT